MSSKQHSRHTYKFQRLNAETSKLAVLLHCPLVACLRFPDMKCHFREKSSCCNVAVRNKINVDF